MSSRLCLILLFFALGQPGEAVDFSVKLKASGTERTTEEFSDNFGRIEIRGGRKCIEKSTQICLPDECIVDFNRTYTTPTVQGHGYGQGGPGYGVVINSVNNHRDNGIANYSLQGKCLNTFVKVCAKRRRRGWYEGYHVVYGLCAVEGGWQQETEIKGPFSITPAQGWVQLGVYDGSVGSGKPNLFTIDHYSVEVTSKDPPNAPIQVGMFSANGDGGSNPDTHPDNGPVFWAFNTAENDLTVEALEVTQGIQNVASDMPLVASRRTMVRAHVASLLIASGVQARLRGFRDGTELASSPLAPEGPIQVRVSGDRLELNHSYLFDLPPLWRKGDVKLRIELDYDDKIPEIDEGNNTFEREVSFKPGKTLQLTTVPFRLFPEGDKDQPRLIYRDDHPTFPSIVQDLLRYFPVSQIEVNDCGVGDQRPLFGSWDLTKSKDRDRLISRVMWVKFFNSCGSSDQHWVGLVHPDAKSPINGTAITPGRSSWVKMNNTMGPAWSHHGGATMAHELSHNRGIQHVKCNGNEGSPDSSYPYPHPKCQLAAIDEKGFYGLDVYHDLWGLPRPAIFSNDPAVPDHRAFPLLGYRRPRWISPYNYCRLLKTFGIPCKPSGFSLRLTAVEREKADAVHPRRVGEYLIAGGIWNKIERKLEELEIYRMPSALNLAQPQPRRGGRSSSQVPNDNEQDTLTLVQLDTSGAVVDSRPFEVYAGADGSQGIYPFVEHFPRIRNSTRLQILSKGQILHDVTASRRPPTIRRVRLPRGPNLQGGEVLRWRAVDLDGDHLRFSVFYSPDDGDSWRLLALGIEENKFRLPALHRLPGSAAARLRVVGHDGFHINAADSRRAYVVASKPPRVSILHPEGQQYRAGETVSLIGMASDIDGDLDLSREGAFRWISDVAGFLGQGLELHTRRLSKGMHRITLEATDSGGRIGRDSRVLFIGIRRPRMTWTRWLNRDSPGGSGDFETLRDFIESGQVCTHPVGIECRTLDKIPWFDTGQTLLCSPSVGGVCLNRDQVGEPCLDYHVRFLCPARAEP